MIHIRTDEEELNSHRRFACGIGPELPLGDQWLYPGLHADWKSDCPGCNPHPRHLGTPLSQLSGRPGEPGFDKFCAIARSWGYD